MKRIRIGLVGQPNVGKSTLFNVLTKGNAIVTNWPGTTVEKHEGVIRYKDFEVVIVDLPGIYGLSYLTLEERITRRFIVEEKPDLIIVLVDSLNIERTLYLVIELRELTGNVIVVVTKVDEAHSKGIHINYEILERRLGVPVVPVSALKRMGLDRLFEAVVKFVGREGELLRVDYGELEPFITSIEQILNKYSSSIKYPLRWISVKLLEGDVEVEQIIKNILGSEYEEVVKVREEARARIGIDLAAYASLKRMSFIREYIVKNAIIRSRVSYSMRRIDKIFFNPFIAPVTSFGIMVGIFLAAFIINTGYPLTVVLESLGFEEAAEILESYSLSSLVEITLSYLSNTIRAALGEGVLTSFIVDGVIGGIAAVLVFVPLVFLVMTFMAALEDSGILPRVAIGTHVLFQKVGLSGHSLLPITLSLGCNVPGIMAARANPNVFERIKMIILAPFIPCQARLVVILAIATAIGGAVGAFMVPLTYFTSFATFIALSYVITLTARRRIEGVETELLLEIPPIHKPHPMVVWWFAWFYLKHFLVKAGTIILVVNIVSWFLQHLTLGLTYTDDVGNSIAAYIARGLTPLLTPLGISGENAWILGYAVLVGFLAKELVISAIITSTGLISFEEAFQSLGLSIPSAIAFTMFITLYIPCAATIATIYSESRSIKYVVVSFITMLLVAYFVAMLSYFIASIFI